MILKKNHLKQKELAKELDATESYTSALLNDRNTSMSRALVTLIEEECDYNSSWILTGAEPKLKVLRKNKTLSGIHKETILKIKRLQLEQIKAVLVFLDLLDNNEENKQQY